MPLSPHHPPPSGPGHSQTISLGSRILPVLALLLLCSCINSTNIGNAKILGFEHDTDVCNNEYNQGIALFYVTHLAGSASHAFIRIFFNDDELARYRYWFRDRNRWCLYIPFLVFISGLFTIALGFAKNHKQYWGIRFLAGFFHGALLPSMMRYLALFYTREQRALRMGLLYTAAPLSGALGGGSSP